MDLRERLDTQPAVAKVMAQAVDDFDKALAYDCSGGGDTPTLPTLATDTESK